MSDADVLKRVQSWANCRDNEAHDRYALGYIRELIRPLAKRASAVMGITEGGSRPRPRRRA